MAKITQSYGFDNPLQEVFPKPIVSNRAPTTTDKKFPIGQQWVNKTAGTFYGLSSVVAGSADWEVLGGSGGDVNTLTGTTGGAVPPAAGTINLAAGTGIAIVGDPGTSTLTFSSAGTAAESLTGDSGGAVSATANNISLLSGTGMSIIGDPGTSTLTFTSAASSPETLTGNSGGAVSATLNDISLIGSGGVLVTGNPGTSTLTITAPGGSAFPVSAYTVGIVGEADYQTIAAAITAATATGGTIYIQDGTYSENLTLVSGVNLRGNDGTSVIISGIHVPPATGSLTIENIAMTGTSAIFSLATPISPTLILKGVNISLINGICFELAAMSGTILMLNCTNLGTTIDAILDCTSGCTFIAKDSTLGEGTTPFTNTDGESSFYNCTVSCPILVDGIGIGLVDFCSLEGTFTTAGSAVCRVSHTNIDTVASDCVTHNSTEILTVDESTLNSGGTYAIGGTGSGIVYITSNTFFSPPDIQSSLTNINGYTSISNSYRTSDPANAVLIEDNEVTGFGAGADVDILLTPKGIGKIKSSSDVALITAGTSLVVTGGAATDFIGSGVLVNGTVTILNTNIAVNDVVLITRVSGAASTTLGELSVVITANTNFVVNSLQTAVPGSIESNDVSTFTYFIVKYV